MLRSLQKTIVKVQGLIFFYILWLMIHVSTVYADGDSGGSSDGGTSSGGAMDGGTSSGGAMDGGVSSGSGGGGGGGFGGIITQYIIPDWVKDLVQKIDNMWVTLQDLMSGKFIHDAINKTTVMFVDEGLSPLYGIFGKSYLFTPRLAEMDLVYTGWTAISIVCLVLLIIALGILAKQVISGKKEMSRLLKVFAIALIAVFISLTAMNMVTVMVNWITQKMLEGTLKTTNINYQGLDGQQVMKAIVIGADALKDPAYAAKTMGQIVLETEGGLITLFSVTALIVLPLFAISALKILVLILLTILVGAWITTAAFSGRMEVLIGFSNLYVRTLLVGFFLSLHWGLFVKAQTDYGRGVGLSADIGIAPIWLAMITVIILVIWLFFFWLRPIVAAVKDPITLAGGSVVEKAGQWGERVSQAVNQVGKRLGSEGLQRQGLNMTQASQKVAEFGRRMQEQQARYQAMRMASVLTGGVSEAIQQVEYKEPTEWTKETGSLVTTQLTPTDLAVPQMSSAEIQSSLSQRQYQTATHLQFKESDRAAMAAVAQRISQAKPGVLQWNTQTGSLFILEENQDEVGQIIQQFSESQLTAQQVSQGMAKEGAFVDLKDKSVQNLSGNQAIPAETMEELKHALPLYSKLKLSPEEARAAHQYLLQQHQEYPWTRSVQFKNDALWIPTDRLKEAKQLLENVIAKRHLVRLDMPPTSAFLGDLVRHIKEQEPELEPYVSAELQNNFVLVQQDHVDSFHKTYEAFRKNRTPYWRTSGGAVKVIVDGVPVDYGGVPRNGMNMGSFERLQSDAMRQKLKEPENPKKSEDEVKTA